MAVELTVQGHIKKVFSPTVAKWLDGIQMVSPTSNGAVLCVVDRDVVALASTLEVSVYLLGIARELFSGVDSVAIVSGDVYTHILEEAVDIVSVSFDT